MKSLIPFICILISACSSQQRNDHQLELNKLTQGIYIHTTYKKYDAYGWVDSHGLVLVKNQQAVIIDTPWSEAETIELVDWIKNQDLTITASISTHFHEDRTAGVAWLNSQSIPTFASPMTNQLLKQQNQATTSHELKGNRVSMLGGFLEVYYPGEGHTKDNSVVWLPTHNILFGGCLFRSLAWHTLGNTADANIHQWSKSISNIQHMYPNIKHIIPGHGKTGDASILTHTIAVLERALEKTTEANK